LSGVFWGIGSNPALARICFRNKAARSSQASRVAKTGIWKCVCPLGRLTLRESFSGISPALETLGQERKVNDKRMERNGPDERTINRKEVAGRLLISRAF
jgi:hypothetical protein